MITMDDEPRTPKRSRKRVAKRARMGKLTMDDARPLGADIKVVGAFPVEENDELVLVTDGGQLIRAPVHDIRIAGRATRGVTVFRVGAEERVVSVARLAEDDDEDAGEAEG